MRESPVLEIDVPRAERARYLLSDYQHFVEDRALLAEMVFEDPDARRYPVHCGAMIDLGLPLGEFWVLDELAADCADDGVYECFLVAPPLHIPGAVGSPLNPIAIK